MRPRYKHHDDQRAQGKQQINQAAGHTGQREQILGHIGLFQQRGIAGDGINGLGRGCVHIVEQKLTAEQIHREILDIPPEHGGKHHRHNNHDEQGVEDAPNIPQPTATILQLDVFLDQQGQ